jgi:predicted nucleic acid-binding Zn ribbon protein
MEQLFGAISKVISDLEADSRGRQALVFAAWRRAAGAAIAAKAAPVDVIDQRLTVKVRDETWLSHLEALAPQMLAKINKLVGKGTITWIEFRSGS